MLWYAIQTYTGKEEQLVEMIRRMVPKEYFGECFVPYFERLRRWHQQNQICVLRLFPGYVFLSTDDIEGVYRWLKKLPAMSKVLTAGMLEFISLYAGEVEFLMRILDSDHIVRLTYAATDGNGNVTYMAGPLEKCRDRIQAYRFRDRYAQVCLTIAGQEKKMRMGLILDNDIRREMAYGKVEACIAATGGYIPVSGSNADLKSDTSLRPVLFSGDRVVVVGGVFKGNIAVIYEAGTEKVIMKINMFGRNIPVEVSVGEVRKMEK